MGYLDQRQTVISQNIANADTPNYRPNDLKPMDFGSLLDKEQGTVSVRPLATHPSHMPAPGQINEPGSDEQESTYEVAPAGNSVIIEEQLVNANHNSMDFSLMTNLYQKNVTMIRTALGR